MGLPLTNPCALHGNIVRLDFVPDYSRLHLLRLRTYGRRHRNHSCHMCCALIKLVSRRGASFAMVALTCALVVRTLK
jgi:hypothetical protein